MDWNRTQQHTQHSQHSQSYRTPHNVPPPQSEISVSNNRYMNNHSVPIPKSGGSPSFHGDPQKLNYQSNKAPSPPNGPPVHVPNGYSHGHGAGVGGMIGTHTDVPPQPSQQPPPMMQQHQMPPLRGQNSAFSKKYYNMENAKSKDGPLQSQPPQNIPNRQIIPNGSPPLNEHGMLNPPMVSHHQPQVNGNMYNSREPQHPGYPPIQPNTGYIHSSESANSGVPPRRVSEPSMHSHLSVNAGSRNGSHGYPSTHVNGPPPPIEEHQQQLLQPQSNTSHRHSMSSPNLPNPNLLPPNTSAPTQKHSSLPNILPANQHPSRQHVSISNGLNTTPPSISRAPTALPPIQSTPHHHHVSNTHAPHHHHHYPSEHQNHAHHGHSHHYHPVSQPPQPSSVYMSAPPLVQHHQYSGKSASPQIPPQSPVMNNPSRQPPQGPPANHYHQGPPQSGSNRMSGISTSHHHHHHHHHSTPSDPVGPPINNNPPTSNILREPLTRFLDQQSQPNGYGSSVHHHPNGVPGGHIGGPPPVQRAYY
ncbi:unnamed protein product [Rhizophagus irregularis]|nr:unnamed protein product [Rhizophagus irregularis]